MTPIRIFAIAGIIAGATVAWITLGKTLSLRTELADEELSRIVAGNWGTEMTQLHPRAFYISPTAARTKRIVQPETSTVTVDLRSDPKKKGLLWYRTYSVEFSADYLFRNPTSISQTVYINFEFPSKDARFDRFSFVLGDDETDQAPQDGKITESVILQPNDELNVSIAYSGTGIDRWSYSFGEMRRVRGFSLSMATNFLDINIPAGSESPTSRKERKEEEGFDLQWDYEDLIGANSIAMDMPAVTNPGPVAARITFFAPVSLVFFFAVLVIMSSIQSVNLHPVNYSLLAGGCFSFQLLFVYLVDLISVNAAFTIAAFVSLVLVSGYLAKAVGFGFARMAAVAQFAFMVLFSYSFFFEGLTGITITIGAVATLALLMGFTAKTDWSQVISLSGKKTANA